MNLNFLNYTRTTIFVVYLIFYYLIMLLPSNIINTIDQKKIHNTIDDNYLHFFSTFILAYLFFNIQTFKKKPFCKLLILFLLIVTKELLQILIPSRNFNVFDLMIDFFSIVIVFYFAKNYKNDNRLSKSIFNFRK